MRARKPGLSWNLRWPILLSGLIVVGLVIAGCGILHPPATTPAPTPLPVRASASISGRAWQDLCSLPLGEAPSQPPQEPGCVALADGTFQANGLQETGEPGLSGLRVELASGECPGVPIAEMTSDANGAFGFASLAAGLYCLSIDANDPSNASVLGSGRRTSPDGASLRTQARREVTVAAGEHVEAQDFGWDVDSRVPFTLATTTPTPAATPAGCATWPASLETSPSRMTHRSRPASPSARSGACATTEHALGRPPMP